MKGKVECSPLTLFLIWEKMMLKKPEGITSPQENIETMQEITNRNFGYGTVLYTLDTLKKQRHSTKREGL